MKAEFLLKKIKNEFPQLKWEKYQHITHGWDHDVIILDKKIVFRFPKSKKYANKLSNEIQLLDHLKKKVKVGVPEYIYISKDKSIAGYKMLSGQELTPSRFRKFSASEKNKILKQLAKFISTMHATPKSIVNKYNVYSENQNKLYEKLVRDTKKIIFPRLHKKDTQVIEQYFSELKNVLDYTHSNALVHNDLTWEHILWDNKKKQINIIDFSDHAFGDPAIDFNGLLEYGVKFTKTVLKLYTGKKDNQTLYRSQLYFKRIPLFIMKNTFNGAPCSFQDGYESFKKRFKI